MTKNEITGLIAVIIKNNKKASASKIAEEVVNGLITEGLLKRNSITEFLFDLYRDLEITRGELNRIMTRVDNYT